MVDKLASSCGGLLTPHHTEGACLKLDALCPFFIYMILQGNKSMLVLIDESGDCGLKFGRGSSDFFTCTAVVFSSEFAANACDRAIDELRRELKKPSGFEFHFSTFQTDSVRPFWESRL